jgi:hypothetical protein
MQTEPQTASGGLTTPYKKTFRLPSSMPSRWYQWAYLHFLNRDAQLIGCKPLPPSSPQPLLPITHPGKNEAVELTSTVTLRYSLHTWCCKVLSITHPKEKVWVNGA